VATKLSHSSVARLIAFIDAASKSDVDVRFDGMRLKVNAWHEENGVALPAANPTPILPSKTCEIEIPSPSVGFFSAEDLAVEQLVEIGERIGSVTDSGDRDVDIVASAPGKLVEICVMNGEPVEYGQVIAVLKP